MNWLGLGLGVWSIRLRELEHFARRMREVSRRDPEEELPEVEISDGERRAALQRASFQRRAQERV